MDRVATPAAEGWRSPLTNLGRTKPRGPGAIYGERGPTSGAAAMNGRDRGREGCAQGGLFPETSDAQGSGLRWTRATSAGSGGCGQLPLVRCLHRNRWRIDPDDGHFIMLPSPEAVLVIAAFALAGIFR